MEYKDKATEAELGEIHGAMAAWCKLILQGVPLLNDAGRAVLKPDGQPWLSPPSPANMNIVRQFLKDNKVDSPSTADKVKDLVPSLPDFSGEPSFTH